MKKFSLFFWSVIVAFIFLSCQKQLPLSSLPTLTSSSKKVIAVEEGTNMAVALSPDRQLLVIDLQGRLWTLPAKGGKRLQLQIL